MNKLLWLFLDWTHTRDPSLIDIDENHQYHINWDEVSCLPEFALGTLRCQVFNRHGLPFFGTCSYCGKELKPGDYIGWFERYDPEGNEFHALLTNPFSLMVPLIKLGIHAKYEKMREDADALFKEAHK